MSAFALLLAALCWAGQEEAADGPATGASATRSSTSLVSGSVSSGTTASDADPSGTEGGSGGLLGSAQLRVRQVYVGANQEASLLVPDGDGRMVVENTIMSTIVRVGMHYSFLNGRIRAWVTYMVPVVSEDLRVELGVSDEAGLGRLYRLPGRETTRYFERAQNIPLGISLKAFPGSWAVSAGRMFWRFGQLDIGQQWAYEVLDSVSIRMNARRTALDIVESKVYGETALGFKHVFRGAGGDYRFDKLDADVFWRLPAARSRDRWRLRTFLGQVYNINPGLPLREKYSLGGASTLKGYDYQEFLGDGMALVGSEYAFGLPVTIVWKKAGVELGRIALLGFVEGGRIQDTWFSAPGETKSSAGIGIELGGKVLGIRRSSLQFYVAQASEVRERAPVFYLLAEAR